MVNIENSNGILICSLIGHLDTDMANQVFKKINKSLEEPIDQILIDLSEVQYVSSAGIKIFFNVAKAMETKQGVATLCNVNSNIKKIFKLAALDKVIPIYEDRAQALNFFSEHSSKS